MTPSHSNHPPPTDGPDANSLQAQLAALVENGDAELRPLLEFLRTLLNARALAVLPVAERPGLAACVITTPGIPANAVAQLAASLDFAKANVLPAPALGADGWTLAVPVRRENAPHCWLIAQIVIPNQRDVQAFLVLLQTSAGYLLYREQRSAMRELGW